MGLYSDEKKFKSKAKLGALAIIILAIIAVVAASVILTVFLTKRNFELF